MKRRPLFIGGEVYRRPSFGPRHPLAIPRVSTVIDLARALGWLPDDAYIDSPRATADQLARFHDPDYIAAVMVAEARQHVTAETRARYNLDTIEAPVYGDMFRRPATACGASIRAAELVRHAGVVYSPASGTHHGRPDRASGFCFFNDPVLGLLRLLDLGVERRREWAVDPVEEIQESNPDDSDEDVHPSEKCFQSVHRSSFGLEFGFRLRDE